MRAVTISQASLGNTQVNDSINSVIQTVETAFPKRVRGYYVQGSCADGAVTPLSDIDLVVVFKEQLQAGEAQLFSECIDTCKRASPRSLDISCIDESTVFLADQLRFQEDWRPVLESITLKCASVLVYGVDICPAIPFVQHAVYRRTLMHFPYLVLAGQRKHPTRLPYPLDYIDSDDAFFGYAGRLLQAADGTLVPSTKRITHASGFIATALVALYTTTYVADKRVALKVYREQINDDWADHLEAVHQYCRLAWDYRVPEQPDDRAILRALCVRERAFENHFLAIYKDYLAREQFADDPAARAFAHKRAQLLG